MTPGFGPRRAVWIDTTQMETAAPLSTAELRAYETLDSAYRSLCAMLYNYAPLSGHPGGSISSGRFVASLLFDTMGYDLSDPHRDDADIISYAAGHKALGLYSMWALRNEIARIAAPELLAASPANQLRLEDLLGFRRNPTNPTPIFRAQGSKALDGHPTPATPFIKGGVTDLLWFLNNNKPDAPSLTGSGWYPGKYIKLFIIKILSLLNCYHGVST